MWKLGGAGGPSETEARPGGLDFDCWGDAHSGWAELLDFTAAVSLAGEGHGGCECHRAEAGRFALAERTSLASLGAASFSGPGEGKAANLRRGAD